MKIIVVYSICFITISFIYPPFVLNFMLLSEQKILVATHIWWFPYCVYFLVLFVQLIRFDETLIWEFISWLPFQVNDSHFMGALLLGLAKTIKD